MFRLLQSYRGIAAVAVAAFHLSIGLGDPRYLGQPVFEKVTWRMDLGVDFFFVLSGFIIMMAHRKDIGQPSRLGSFFEKRFVRIYPVYWIYTGGFCAFVAIGLGSVSGNPNTIGEWLTTFTLVRFENFLLPISPAWTLIHEVAFYLAFSLIILHRQAGLAAFVLWQLVCLILFTYPGPSERTPFATYFAAYNFDFALGMLAFIIYDKRLLHRPAIWLTGGLAILMTTLFIESTGYPFKGYKLFYALAFAAVIVASVKWEVDRTTPLRIRLLPFLGDASYTIYLVHNPLEGAFTKIALRTVPSALAHPYVIYVLVLGATIAASCIVHVAVERPVLALSRQLSGRRERGMGGAAASRASP